MAFLERLEGVSAVSLLAELRLPDLGVALGLPPALGFLGVAGTPVDPAALALSLRLILPKVTLAEPEVY